MDIDERKIGEWPNVALIPGTHIHAATGEHVEQPESTRIGRSRSAGDTDTREKLENDTFNFIARMVNEAYMMGEHEANWHVNRASVRECIGELLDRQAAITERQCMERATSERVGWDCAECAEGLGKRIAELTAERDRLKDVVKVQANSFAKLEQELALAKSRLKAVKR